MAKSQLNSGKSGCRGLSEEERRAQGCPLISAQGIVHTQQYGHYAYNELIFSFACQDEAVTRNS